MTKASACDEHDPHWLSLEQASVRILDQADAVKDTQRLGLREALNHVLAENVRSPINVPSYANSAMDGYAVRSNDLPDDGAHTLQLVGTSWAGTPFDGELDSGQCVRIMTGAKMPSGTDTVIMQEQVQRNDTQITIGNGHMCGENVRYPGDDIKKDSVVLTAGKRLTPADLGVVASLGIPELTTFRPLKVAFFSTGDELKPVGEPLAEGQIYDSNRYTLHGMLTRLGVSFVDLGIIPDQPEAVEQAFLTAADQADVVITTGGVSVGDADYVKATLEKLGLVDFWKISMKPGKPLAFGRIKQAAFFGLPGNPVSVMATFYQLVQPALRKMTGETNVEVITLSVPTTSTLKKRPGRTDFQRGILHYNDNGELVVSTTGMQGSHVLSSMSEGNCFIVLPAESGSVEAGSPVTVQPFSSLV